MPARFAIPEETREQCKALFLQGLPVPEISVLSGVKPATIFKWIERFHWTDLRDTTKSLAVRGRNKALTGKVSPAQMAIAMPSKSPSMGSRALREQLSAELQQQVAALAAEPVKRVSELRNTPEGEGRASVVKRIAETAAIVHDWDSEKAPGLVIVSAMDGCSPEDDGAQGARVQDVEASAQMIQDAEPEPAPVDWGSLQAD